MSAAAGAPGRLRPARQRVGGANDRAGLERLCRHILRPPFAQERLRLRGDGRVALELKRAWHDGTRELVFEPEELLERLAAMTPRPETNLLICCADRSSGNPACGVAGLTVGGEARGGGRSSCLRPQWVVLRRDRRVEPGGELFNTPAGPRTWTGTSAPPSPPVASSAATASGSGGRAEPPPAAPASWHLACRARCRDTLSPSRPARRGRRARRTAVHG